MDRIYNQSKRGLFSLIAMLIFLATLGLTGCASQSNAASSTATKPAQPSQETQAASGASAQGVLRVTANPIAQTDPAKISSDAEVLIANHVYDYLVDIDPNNEIQPRLATSWTHSSDGLSYTFSLARGVTFHDGSPLTAEDVVWTFNRLRDPASGFPTVDIYQNITNIEASGDLTVTFTLSQTNPFFLYDLSDNHTLILKAGTQNPGDFNGTGPFVVKNYVPTDRIVMEANKDYFIKGQPKLAELDIIFFSDQNAATDAVRGGQADLDMDLTTQLYESLKQLPGLVAYNIPTNQFPVIRLRTDMPPGNDPRVIQALKLATDRTAIFKLVQQGYGAVGRDSPIGPVYKNYYTEATPIPARDPAAAKKLLADAGYPNGLDLDLNLLNTLNFPDLAAVIKQQWAEAGINVNIVTLPESVYYGEGKWLEVDLGITGWGHRPYPQFYLDVMLTCGAKWNESRFCDPEFDRLAKEAGSTLDEQTRIDDYHKIQQILIERGPIIVPYFFAKFAVISDRFVGFQLKPFSGRTDFRTVSLKP